MGVQLDLTHALTDVRKAYRLIWLYQRRVVDIIRLVTETLGYRFYRWETEDFIGRMPGQVTKNPFGDWEWIWATLPLYRMSLCYFPASLDWNVQKVGEWMLEIFVETDTGVKHRDDDSEPSPTEFTPASQSETFLRLYAWYCTQDGSLDWYRDIWQELDWPEQDGEVAHSNLPIKIVRKSFDISKLPDRASVERALTEFRGLISEKFQLSASPPPTTSIRLRG